jgi:transposase-like protein
MEQFCQNKKQLPAPHPGEIREQALALHKEGTPSSEIADRLNLPPATVRSWVRRQRKKDSPAQPILSPVVEVKQVQPIEIEIPSELSEQARVFEENMREAAVKLSYFVKNLPAAELAAKADKLHKANQTARQALRLETDRPVCVLQLGVLCQSPQSGRLASAIRPQKLLKSES